MFNKIRNGINKVISFALSLSVLAGSFGICTKAETSVPANTTTNLSNAEKFKKFTKEHPNLSILGFTTVGAALVSGVVFGGKALVDKFHLRHTATEVDSWDEARLNQELKSQIQKFENSGIQSGQKIFEVTEEARTLIPCKVLFRFMQEINSVIEKYPNIIAKYKRQLASGNHKFSITGEFSNPTANGEAAAATVCRLGEFTIYSHFFGDLNQAKLGTLGNVRSGYHPPCDRDKLIELHAAHEMGHIIQHALCNDDPDTKLNEHTFKPEGDFSAPGWRLFSREALAAGDMRKQIINKAGTIGYTGDGYISSYGDTDNLEWFAEVCAHAFCSSEPNGLGRAMLEFLQEYENKLNVAPMPTA